MNDDLKYTLPIDQGGLLPSGNLFAGSPYRRPRGGYFTIPLTSITFKVIVLASIVFFAVLVFDIFIR